MHFRRLSYPTPLLFLLLLALTACAGQIGSADEAPPSPDAGVGGITPDGGNTGGPTDVGRVDIDGGFTQPDSGVDPGGSDVGFNPTDTGVVTTPPAALSTRSLTNHTLGSNPGTITISPGRLTIDLSDLQGATVYRATLDPYIDPPIFAPDIRAAKQREPRRLLAGATPLSLLPPRKLTFDATAVVQAALDRGETQLVLDYQNMAIQTASLDVLCNLPALASLPVVQSPSAQHLDGDTMITFAEHQSPLAAAESTFGAVQAARAQVRPSAPGKVRYRIYRSLRPFDDPGDVIDAELVDEIPPLTGWGDEILSFDVARSNADVPVTMLPIDDLTPAPPGTGIYVRRHGGPDVLAWYLVSYTVDGAESFDTLASTEGVMESAGPGLAFLVRQEVYDGQWVYTGGINIRLDYFARWSPLGEHPTPSEPFHYRVAVPTDPVNGPRPAAFFMHAWGGSVADFTEWMRYGEGTLLVGANHQRYTSYTGFHEGFDTLVSWDEGTVQPYYWARNLAFMFDFVTPRYNVDTDRLYMFGFSMGGAGTQFWGMRSGHLLAYMEASVGNSIPAEDGPIVFEFEDYGYGPVDWGAFFSNEQLARYGYPILRPSDRVNVWDYFDIRWWFRNNPEAEMPFLSFANAPNDPAIRWGPAWENAEAIRQARQPHQFVWGTDGHGQVAEPVSSIAFRRNQAVVAFTGGSLDTNLGPTPAASPASGQRNRYYRWDENAVVDQTGRFSVPLLLRGDAPGEPATVDVTPRRMQRFRPAPGTTVSWTYGARSGQVQVDAAGIITIPGLELRRAPTTLVLTAN